ncbi:1-deoxy-D-xylulose-5-phosphate synthase [Nonomuraea sp. NPDC050404]|uniref:1-deoxy-D-xylulose-5-phosphate synthase n=1 Tax=Nonomuraea sp. NPDC050404 TaxID=3155783 RepID=UPI0033CC69CC
MLLESLRSPADLRSLEPAQLPVLAGEIRRFLVEAVSKTGGHLGPNLGIVEISIALHRVFDSPRDSILFDTGHQTYVHKLLTGRGPGFATLRQRGGLSGYPSQAESEHDIIENSHASTALSYADGLAKAFELTDKRERTVVAVVGDGALTGGMAWEALNNVAAGSGRQVVIVVNDNGRSYSPTIGGLATHLASLRLNPGYEHALDLIKRTVPHAPVVGASMYEALHGIKKGVKDLLAPQALFEDLGIKFVGPIDGHDIPGVEQALRTARGFGGPVIIHCITRKGRGYAPAEDDVEDCLHGPGAFDPETGQQLRKPGLTWTQVFSDELADIGSERPDVVAITAAMLHPTGLASFAKRFPDRVFDVGIAEQHAVTSAAGLALGGLHPVVAIYATFLNRAFDQVLMDVALHRLPVTFALDRAGITGNDGASHHGMWDLSLLSLVPGLRIAVPRDAARLRRLLRECVADGDGPTAIRYPKGPVPTDMVPIGNLGGMDILLRTDGSPDLAPILLIAVGPMAEVCVRAARLLRLDDGPQIMVIDPLWVKPLDPALVDAAALARLVAVVEDNGQVGAVGDAVARLLRDHDVDVPVRTFGIPQRFLGHAGRAEILEEIGLTPQRFALVLMGLLCDGGAAYGARHHGRRPMNMHDLADLPASRPSAKESS